MKNFFGDRLHSNNTEENTSPRKIRSLKYIEPVNKQVTDQPTPSAQSDGNSIIQGLKRALDKLGNRLSTENREKITKEYNQACIILDVCRKSYEELDNQRKQNPPVPLTAEQQEFIEVFEKASEYNHKAKEYKDQFSIDQKPETFINDLEMVNQKLRKNKLVQDTVFSASVKTDSSGKITIDLAKFVPSAIDLSKLDLSNQERDTPDTIEVNLTSIDKSSFKNPFIYDLGSTLFLARMALKSGYIYTTYNTHSQLYRKVLEHYLQARVYLELKKTNLSQNDFTNFIDDFNGNTARLIVNNNMNRIIEGHQSDKSIHTSHHSSSYNLERSHQDDPETQRKKNELKALFSDDQSERNATEEKLLMGVYFEKWQDKEQQPNTLRFMATYQLARNMLHKDIEQNDLLKTTLPKINQSFREIARDNPEQFRPALKQAMETTRTLHHWATNFQDRFDLNEEWAQTGMKKFGITNDILETSLKKLPDALPFTQEILGSRPISDLVGECDASKIVQHFEDLTRANLALKRIHNLLKDGIPVEDTPRQINGLERVPISANEQNCLIHALLKVDRPEWDMQKIVKSAKSIRNNLATKMKKKLYEYTQNQEKAEKEAIDLPLFSERYEAVQSNNMLDIGSYDGKELINYLCEQNLIKPNRGVLVYQLSNGKIQCIEQVPPILLEEKQKPYSLFLYQDYHFEAMIKSPKQEGERPNQADGPSTS